MHQTPPCLPLISSSKMVSFQGFFSHPPFQLQDLKPDLVFTRISGYGQTGPKAQQAGYASVCEAYGGFRHINGYPGEWVRLAGVGR